MVAYYVAFPMQLLNASAGNFPFILMSQDANALRHDVLTFRNKCIAYNAMGIDHKIREQDCIIVSEKQWCVSLEGQQPTHLIDA